MGERDKERKKGKNQCIVYVQGYIPVKGQEEEKNMVSVNIVISVNANTRSNWIRRILSDGFKICCYTMIEFDQLLSGVCRLCTLFSSDIRPSDLLNPDQIYVTGNSKIRSIRSVCTRCDSGAFDVRKTSEYVLLNDT